VVLGLFAGFTAQGSWQTWLSFRNSTDFGRTDPQFGLDLSFFVFDYPFYRLALGFGFAIVVLALIGSLVTHYVFGGLRLQTPGQKLTGAAMVQLSVLLGLFVALKAVAYWLDRYALVYSDRGGLFTGASYTDVNALLPAKTILVFAAAFCAIAFFANIVVRNFRQPVGEPGHLDQPAHRLHARQRLRRRAGQPGGRRPGGWRAELHDRRPAHHR
jgi:uncharacterized membrane protein (UPF0182 family)